jgi:DNA-binding NtrC family response regulator
MSSRRVLIVDDDRHWAEDYRAVLAERAVVDLAADAKEAAAAVEQRSYDAVLLDHRFHGREIGLDILRRLRALDDGLPVVLLTGDENWRLVKESLRLGADYVSKNAPFAEQLLAMERAFQKGDLMRELARARKRLQELEGDWVGESPSMQEVLRMARKVAATSVPVLVQGETGTGKGTLVRLIHRMSGRPGEAIFCHGSLGQSSSPEAIESLLFGHLKGSFTGADRDRDGLVCEAGRGTFVLDDVEDLPNHIQGKLLTLLEEGTYRPYGGARTLTLEARVMATAKPGLEERVRSGGFRADLYHRIRVYPIFIPPLRERIEDIVPLSLRFLTWANQQCGRGIERLHPDAQEWLRHQPWSGNARELRNAVLFAAIQCEGEELHREHFLRTHVDPAEPAGPGPESPLAEDWRLYRREMGRRYAQKLLRCSGGNVTQAAKLAGLTREGFRQLLQSCSDPPSGNGPALESPQP